MIPVNLFITTMFTIVFSYNNNGNDFQRRAWINYATYECTHNEVDYDRNFVQNLYDYNYYNENTSITVLTHGLGGNADYWFPKNADGSANYMSSESLAYKIISNQSYSLTNIPIFTFEPSFDAFNRHIGTEIKQLKQLQNNNYQFQPYNITYSSKYVFNKHVILIYDDSSILNAPSVPNSVTASCFCDCLDSVLARMSMFYQGNLPKINLIGHSRGGILNLYYANKREKIVDTFITLGTPLNGSKWANVLNSYIKLGRLFFEGETYNNDPFFSEDYDGLLNFENICNHQQMLASLVHPYVVAIGAEMTPSIFCSELLYEIGLINSVNINEITFGTNNIISRLFTLVVQYILNNNNILMSTVNQLCSKVYTFCNDLLDELAIYQDINDLIALFANVDPDETDFGQLCNCVSNLLNDIKILCLSISNYEQNANNIRGDFCVDLDSQLGTSLGNSNIDQRITFRFGVSGNDNLLDKYLSNALLPKVVHNYECNFPSIVNQIYSILYNRNCIQAMTIPGVHDEVTINPYQVPFYNLTSYFQNQFYYNQTGFDHYFFGNEFEFRDYYYYEHEISHNESLLEKSIFVDDIEITTHRMRTGYIQNERIVLSPNREDAGLAFIEFYFSEPIHGLYFDVSLWSSTEYITESNEQFVCTLDMHLRDFVFGESEIFWNCYHQYPYVNMTERGKLALTSSDEIFNIFNMCKYDLSTFPVNRNSPKRACVGQNNGFTYVGFYASCNVTSLDRNKGRICLSNFAILD